MNDILEMKKLLPGSMCPVMMTRIPKPIMREIDGWVKECRKVKDSPLMELRSHNNYGYVSNPERKKYNSYQTAVPVHLIENSYWLAWTLRLATKYWGNNKFDSRQFKVGRWDGHWDGYDVWINFAYQGDENPIHQHRGKLSGVVYYKNTQDGDPTLFPEYKDPSGIPIAYAGQPGTMILFPASVVHGVEKKITKGERITFAFNIDDATDSSRFHFPHYSHND